jgi:hypothetical protein
MKKYAEKMEYLAQIRDASEKSMGRGYWLVPIRIGRFLEDVVLG